MHCTSSTAFQVRTVRTDDSTADHGLRNRLRVWGPAAGWAAVLFLLSAWPDPGGIPAFPFSDKVTHVGLYGILGIALGYGWSRSPRPIAHGILIALGALYGVTDEWHQVFVPGRVPDVADWLVDVLGLILGYGAVVVFIYRLKRPIQMNGTE